MSKEKGKQYIKVKISEKSGLEVDASMDMENIAYVIGHLLIVLEDNGYGPQEKMATSIIGTNREMAKKEK